MDDRVGSSRTPSEGALRTAAEHPASSSNTINSSRQQGS